MAIVIFERTFQSPVSGEQILNIDRRNRWCLQAHGIGAKRHLLSRDGLRICCVFDAPDAESVRTAAQKIDAPPADRVWSATAHGPRADAQVLSSRSEGSERTLVLVERSFQEPVRLDDVQSVEDRGAWCLSLNRVEFLVSWLALDRRRMICLYEAPDAESVSRTNTRLNLPFDRIWSADLYVCDDATEMPPAV
ncbi:nickel-binding protein [Azospirillum soli]|uniref:nickel-binding protein n=1 Tax=Azospirillum soli TaxID=1304799 RepID=UPI001AE517BB|nr:nickel-binding protein [Azospirillum soli]MBP2314558.1 hypothetical protein [Azospirillum soli]